MTSSTGNEVVMPDWRNKASRWTLLGFTAFVDRRAHKVYLCCIDYPLKTKAPTIELTPQSWTGLG